MKSAAVSLDIYDYAAVKQTVQEGHHDDRVLKKFRPIGEGLVGGDNGADFFIAIGDESEKENELRVYPPGINENHQKKDKPSKPYRRHFRTGTRQNPPRTERPTPSQSTYRQSVAAPA